MTRANDLGGTPPTRRTLLLRLRDWKDDHSWQEFYGIYARLIRGTALKAGLTREEAQEVVQDTMLAVAKQIRDFNYDPHIGSFKNWLLRITQRRAADQLRKRRPESKNAAGADAALEQVPDPTSLMEQMWDEEWMRALRQLALVFVRQRVGPLQYRMFEMYVMECRPLAEIRRILGVSSAQIYMAKYRITRMLKKEVRRMELEDV